MSANIPYRARPRQSEQSCCNPDYPCPLHRPASMMPSDPAALDRMMRGNRPGTLQVVSYANWSWKPRGCRHEA